MYKFPSDFLWGVATSAYQIEGGADERGRNIWDTFSHTPQRVFNNEHGDTACDHLHRWQEDTRLIEALGVQSYRFSTAWSRILPNGTGQVNEKGLDFYRKLVDGLLEKGIEPNLTLYHWDLPDALGEKGGWLNRDIADWFAEYATVMFKALGDRVKYWTTLNEPWVVAHEGYLAGNHAPGHRNLYEMPKVTHNLLRAHAKAVQAYRGIGADKIGLVVNLEPKVAASDRDEDVSAAIRMNGYMNQQFLDPVYFGTYPEAMPEIFGDAWISPSVEDMKLIQEPFDFLGINFYARGLTASAPEVSIFHAKTVAHPDHIYTEMGWEVYAQALYDVLKWVDERYNKPQIMVTENGAAFYDPPATQDLVADTLRIQYYHKHLEAVHRAIQDGVKVQAYYAWSLMDNFEWGYGYSKRFGLVHVDFSTLQRTPKASYYAYQKWIKESR